MMRRAAHLLTLLAAGLLTAALVLAALEGSARVYGWTRGETLRLPPPVPSATPFTVLCEAPGGMRRLCGRADGPEAHVRGTTFAPVPTRRRLIVIGESFVHGLHLADDQAWPVRLGERLGPDWEVLNFGRCGASSEELLYVARAAVTLRPDLLLLAIGNNEYTMSPFWTGLAGRHPLAFQRAAEVLSRSALYGVLKRLLAPGAPDYLARRLTPDTPHPHQRALQALRGRPADLSPFPGGLADADITALLEDGKRLSERCFALRLEDMVATARAAGVPVALLTLPRGLLQGPPLLSGLHDVPRETVEPLMATLRLKDPPPGPRGAPTASPRDPAIEALLALDPRLALPHHMDGVRRLALRDRAGALAALWRGVELDLVPDGTPSIARITAEIARDADAPVLDLRASGDGWLEEAGRVWRDPVHLNAAGAERVAQEVTRLLDEAHLLDAPPKE